MRNEKRQQKRINFKDDRRPSRTVNTEFWYVPLSEVVDAFSYRVHVISKEVEAKRSNELAQQKYKCNRCRTEYALLEILSEMTDTNEFQCTKMGVRPDRRPFPCGGIIEEEDNSEQIKETERIRQKLDDELRELRTRAAECSKMDIPPHPLHGADEETWGEIVPETVGIHGEAVDEEGLTNEQAAQLNPKPEAADPIPGIDRLSPKEQVDDAFIPEKPSWFKETSNGDDAEDDWVDEQGGQNVLNSKTGTAASFFAEEDEKMYYERYLQEIGGGGGDAATNGKVKAAKTASRAKKATTTGSSEKIDDSGNDDVMVSVAGKKYKLSEVSDEMAEQHMTEEEYKAYFALAQKGSGGGSEEEDAYE